VTSGTSTGKTRGYTYDANSNRLTTTGTTASTETIATASNRLNSTSGGIVRTYGYDNAGNTTSFTGDSFTYNDRGRISQAIVSGSATNYIYNALSQLIEKSGNGGTTLLVYDEVGHILGEYSGTGALVQETIWLGDTPVATLRPNGSSITVYYVHTDHLATPRKVTRPSDNGLMWRWDPDTFGSVAPNTNPAGLGAFTYNLRFPGQYSLSESGLNYNYFRTYDPQMGRYLESDPVGLKGGINTYAYVSNDPVSASDPRGLVMWRGTYYSWSIGFKWAGVEHWTFTLFSDCVNNQKWLIKVSATGAGPGLGLPWTNSGSTVEFDDNSATPSPSAFNGVFKFAAAGFAVPIGYGWSEFIAGSATARLSGAAEAGFDLSFSSGVGQSSVTSKAGPFCCTQ
jgi:RHS repeat-associated protein